MIYTHDRNRERLKQKNDRGKRVGLDGEAFMWPMWAGIL